jgi:hypothetical protein
MTYHRRNDRPMSCDILTHAVTRKVTKVSSVMEYAITCKTCGATWTESEWVS